MAGRSSFEERDYLEAMMQLCEDEYLARARDLEIARMLAQPDRRNSAGPSSNPRPQSPPGHHMDAKPNLANPLIKCSLCDGMTHADACFLPSNCGHSFCQPCIRQHLVKIATETHQYPLPCPKCEATAAGPPAELDPQDCLAVLEGNGAAFGALNRLVLEKKHMKCKRYCANPACNTPFDWVDDPAVRGFSGEFRVTCPSCSKVTCVQCKVQWHEGRSCEQYVAEKDGAGAGLGDGEEEIDPLVLAVLYENQGGPAVADGQRANEGARNVAREAPARGRGHPVLRIPYLGKVVDMWSRRPRARRPRRQG